MRNRLLFFALAAGLLSGCGKKENPNIITATGTIEATDVNIAAKVPAQIVTLYIDDGTPVDSGSLVAVQDHSSLEIQLREAQSAVDQARAQLSLTQQGARIEDIQSAEQAVTQAETNRKLAADELERTQNLVKGGAATKEQLDQEETKFRVAQSQLDQAEANLTKTRHFSRPEEITAATAHVDQLVAARDAIQKMIDDSYITSPLKGTVTHKVAEQG